MLYQQSLKGVLTKLTLPSTNKAIFSLINHFHSARPIILSSPSPPPHLCWDFIPPASKQIPHQPGNASKHRGQWGRGETNTATPLHPETTANEEPTASSADFCWREQRAKSCLVLNGSTSKSLNRRLRAHYWGSQWFVAIFALSCCAPAGEGGWHHGAVHCTLSPVLFSALQKPLSLIRVVQSTMAANQEEAFAALSW